MVLTSVGFGQRLAGRLPQEASERNN